jgi:hypothetical protein
MTEKTDSIAHALRYIASAIDESLREVTGDGIAFALVVNVDGMSQYVSNLDRDTGADLLRSIVAHIDSGAEEVKTDIELHFKGH